jgi:AraC-like DNA-binding protein
MNNVEFHLALNQNDTWNMSRLHFHDYYEFLLPLTSPGNIFVNDQVYPLERGTLYLIGENTLHRTMATGSHARYILHISRKSLSEPSTPQTDFMQLTHDSFRRTALNGDQMTELIELFQALERNKNDGSFGSDIRQTAALLNLLLKIATALNASSAGEAIRNKDFLRVVPILDYIRDNLSDPLTLDQIAGKFFISKHYLCRIFKSATGFSVMEYIIYSRILKARQLLQEGVSVQQAGELSGFSDNSHFIRTFGHLTGTSPGRYAKEYQASDQILLREGSLARPKEG